MIDGSGFESTRVSRIGNIAVLELASNEVNALDPIVLGEVATFVQACADAPDVAALVVTGVGTVFSAGMNVKKILAGDEAYVGELLESFERALLGLLACPIPTVAAVNGPAVAGGCLLACACDRRIVADDARMGVTELRVGVSIGVKTVDLFRQVCGHQAEQLMFDAGLVDAQQACRCGMAHESVPQAELRSRAVSVAGRLGRLDREAYALAKEAARRRIFSAGDQQHRRDLERRSRQAWRSGTARERLEGVVRPR
jgi:enoyl-CoA hydratase